MVRKGVGGGSWRQVVTRHGCYGRDGIGSVVEKVLEKGVDL